MFKTEAAPLATRLRTAGGSWGNAYKLSHAHPHSSDHRPLTKARLAYDDDALYLRFDVRDRFVIARHTVHQSSVCQDSCVEFFFFIPGYGGYFNFEFNCIGTTLAHFNPIGGGARVELDIGNLQVTSSQRDPIVTEIAELDWTLQATIPWSLLEPFGAFTAPAPGTLWRGNFYKCADASSHPHWLCWQPIGTRLSFHKPHRFGPILFA